MPYKDLAKRKAAIQDWKQRNKAKLQRQAQERYKRTYIPYPRKKLSKKDLKLSKARQDKRYRKRNKKAIAAKKARYYQQNKERILKRFLASLKTDINKRIAHNLRNRLSCTLRRKGKAGSAVKDLGCSIERFRKYIESKFQPGMNWKNYGLWHLDHIQPLCRFNLANRNEFLSAAHFTNYQPLWAKHNLQKNRY